MFTHAVKFISINGFDIKLDPSWLVIASLVTWSLSQQYFPETLPHQTTSIYVAMALLGMLGFFASLLLHELAHAVVARRFGVPIAGITLFIFGGMAEMKTEPQSARSELWIAVAGPAMSFALAALFWVPSLMASAIGPLLTVTGYLSAVNLVLALFNLLPAFPMDGGRVLRAYLWHRNGDILQATQTAARFGAVFAYLLMSIGILALFQGALLAGFWQIMIGGFVLFAARASYTSQLARVAFEGKTISDVMSSTPITVGPDLTLSEFVENVMLARKVSFVPVIEADVLLGHIEQSVLSLIDRENWPNTRVGDVYVGLDANAMVPPEMSIQALLNIISETGRRKFMVVTDHHLVGVITLADLSRYLMPSYDLHQSQQA